MILVPNSLISQFIVFISVWIIQPVAKFCENVSCIISGSTIKVLIRV